MMVPINLYSMWNERPFDSQKVINPLRKYFFICEGANTEAFYFKRLISVKKEVGIDSLIELIFIEKTEQDKDLSYPPKLVDFVIKQKDDLIKKGIFDKDNDVMIVIFDLDVFNRIDYELKDILKYQNDNLWFGLTNPDFELFLLLHFEGIVEDIIIPNKTEILVGKKIGNHRPCYMHLLNKTQMNSKKNVNIGKLALDIDIAISQEKLINQDLNNCLNEITSNIALLIEKIKQDKLPFN